jgi:hypothetical protein
MGSADDCIYCDLARHTVQGVRVTTPRESDTWFQWRSSVRVAIAAAEGDMAGRPRAGLRWSPRGVERGS